MEEALSRLFDRKAEHLPQDIEQILDEVKLLDPELLEGSETRQLVELGAKQISELTQNYGTPDHPRWLSGTVESHVFMAYHNGGENGHTSVGPHGVGVPRNVLVIAGKVNEAAGKEVFDPKMRAVAFYAASAHDRFQLCGRSLLPEGQGAPDKGDERLSAEYARQQYLDAGGDEATGLEIYTNIMATAFNPELSRQNVKYDTWKLQPENQQLYREVLGQELLAAADLLSVTSKYAVVNNMRHAVESMCLNRSNRLISQRLLERKDIPLQSITNLGQILAIIGNDKVLRDKYVELIDSEKHFIRSIQFNDDAIRGACEKGIDELFPGRERNAVSIELAAQELQRGATPLMVWQSAKHKAELLD